MNAFVLNNLLDSSSVELLKTSTKNRQKFFEDNSFYAEANWLDADAIPNNLIEKYILDTHKMAYTGDEKIAGFEWWIHDIYEETNLVGLHFDLDEEHHYKTNKRVCPLRSTVTYLTDTADAPTLLLDVMQLSSDPDDVSDTINQAAYSYPKVGKMLSFDSRYLHAALPPDFAFRRLCLMYNVWDYKLPWLNDPSLWPENWDKMNTLKIPNKNFTEEINKNFKPNNNVKEKTATLVDENQVETEEHTLSIYDLTFDIELIYEKNIEEDFIMMNHDVKVERKTCSNE